jgi:hypothetical protein
VVSEATDSWLTAIHQVSLIMTAVPLVAMVVAWILLRPKRTALPS